MKKLAAIILATALLGAGAAVADDKELFEKKCSSCHSLSRPLGQTMDRNGWAATVTRMQKVNGCPITDDEANAIVDYLVKVRGPGAEKEKK